MKIAIAPLDWGLGHATRCIPLIRQFIKDGHEVIILGDGNGWLLLKDEFSALQFVFLRGYRIHYSSSLPAWLMTVLQIPKIIRRTVLEHRALKKITDEHKPGMVISDNRFGLWNKNVKSIYITHQVMIKCPRGLGVFEGLLYRLHRWIIHRYDECWIPDLEGNENLSGDLSHKYKKPHNAKFIGIQSRFKMLSFAGGEIDLRLNPGDGGLCVIISGPEPSRTEFEKIIIRLLKSFQGSADVILGLPDGMENKNMTEYMGGLSQRVRFFSHRNADQLKEMILKSKLVVCRAGYSGIMDLVALKKNAVLVPTPGQTEQEYLAKHLESKKIFRTVAQEDLDLNRMVEDSGNYSVKNFKNAEILNQGSPAKSDWQESLTAYQLNTPAIR